MCTDFGIPKSKRENKRYHHRFIKYQILIFAFNFYTIKSDNNSLFFLMNKLFFWYLNWRGNF